MRYVFDMDGVICTQEENYRLAKPQMEVIESIRDLYKAGHHITIFTARGSETGIDWRRTTEVQLQMWNVPHHRLLLGKPAADVYVDDRAVNVADFFYNEWEREGMPWPASAQS
jgi:hypothetical protein